MSNTEDNWLLKVNNLTKIYGDYTENSIINTVLNLTQIFAQKQEVLWLVRI